MAFLGCPVLVCKLLFSNLLDGGFPPRGEFGGHNALNPVLLYHVLYMLTYIHIIMQINIYNCKKMQDVVYDGFRYPLYQ